MSTRVIITMLYIVMLALSPIRCVIIFLSTFLVYECSDKMLG